MKQMTLLKVRNIVALTLAAATVAACGGGGGGGKSVKPSEPETISGTAAPQNTARVTVPAGSSVLVGVTDTGARISHDEFNTAGLIVGTHNMMDASTDVTDIHGHGTAVASEIAGVNTGFAGNANLLIVKISDGATSGDQVMRGVGYAAENGAKVVNTSFSGWEFQTKSVGLPEMLKLDANDVVWVVAAGNSTLNLSTSSLVMAETGATASLLTASGAPVKDQTIIVGAMDGASLRADSNYAGSNTDIQAMFMVAPGTGHAIGTNASDNSYGSFSQTSSAAPVVAAAAATLRSYWPALTAEQITSLLLTTASKSNDLYSQNTCGSSGTDNCGSFYLGQGELNLAGAMGPIGPLSLPTGTSVASATESVAKSGVSVSPAFGDSFRLATPLSDVAAFDSYGRDYKVDMSSNLAAKRNPANIHAGLSRFVQRTASPASRFTYAFENDTGVSGLTRYDDNGQPLATMMSLRDGSTALSAFHYRQGEADPSVAPEAIAGLQMLSYNGANEVAMGYDQVTGFGSRFGLSDSLSIKTNWWMSHNDSNLADDGTASRSEVALQYQASSNVKLSIGAANLIESDAAFGATGSGAMSLGQGSRFFSGVLGLDATIGKHGSLFARYEQGVMSKLDGGGLIDNISDIRASKFAIGAGVQTKSFTGALSFSSPLRVDSATANLSVPTGRTLNGDVTFAKHSVKLAPSGRERTMEMALAAPAGKAATVTLNMARTFDPGHDATAKPVNTAVISYSTKF